MRIAALDGVSALSAELVDPVGPAEFGTLEGKEKAVVHMEPTTEVQKRMLAVAEGINNTLDEEEPQTWGRRFADALTVPHGEGGKPTVLGYVLHFITVPLKLVYALMPSAT